MKTRALKYTWLARCLIRWTFRCLACITWVGLFVGMITWIIADFESWKNGPGQINAYILVVNVFFAGLVLEILGCLLSWTSFYELPRPNDHR